MVLYMDGHCPHDGVGNRFSSSYVGAWCCGWHTTSGPEDTQRQGQYREASKSVNIPGASDYYGCSHICCIHVYSRKISLPAMPAQTSIVPASPPTGFSRPLTTSSCAFPFAFNPGNSKGVLLPPFNAAHLPTRLSLVVVHVNAPTQGCTFQCNSSVTFPRSANFPEISPIWYLGRTLRSLITPRSDFVGGLVLERRRSVGRLGFSRGEAGMIWSQMTASL